MINSSHNRPRFLPAILLLTGAALLVFAAGGAFEYRAQSIVEAPVAPPPMKFISGEERTQLTRETDTKKRIRTAVELAEARLTRAEQLTAQNLSEAATDQLAAYQSIIENAFAFLSARGRVDNKARDLYKRLEMSMRIHGVRIETMRRQTPSEYSVYVKSVYDFTRNARTEALNSFYGDTVLRQLPAPEPSTGSTPPNKPSSP